MEALTVNGTLHYNWLNRLNNLAPAWVFEKHINDKNILEDGWQIFIDSRNESGILWHEATAWQGRKAKGTNISIRALQVLRVLDDGWYRNDEHEKVLICHRGDGGSFCGPTEEIWLKPGQMVKVLKGGDAQNNTLYAICDE